MRAYVIDQPGGPEALQLRQLPDPQARPGHVLIDVRARGLNRAEVVTRQGGSGNAVKFPRVIGIECVGTVLEAPGTDLARGQVVAAAMGGMGRAYDGSYADQVVVPASNVFPLDTDLDWATLGSIPETYLTAWGCLFEACRVSGSPRVLVRPGASALGLAITQLANDLGGEVIGVTRSQSKVDKMMAAGMADVLVSDGPVAEDVKRRWPKGADAIVETVASSVTVRDGLALRARRGVLCIAGSLAASSGQKPGVGIAAALARPRVRMYSSEKLTVERHGAALQQIVDKVESGRFRPITAEVIGFGQIPDAHLAMESNTYAGKVVVVGSRNL